MYYQLEFITKTQKPNLIIFVHGLTGGRNTWIRNDGQHSVLNYLYANPGLREHYDFAVFSYYTKFSDLLAKLSHSVQPYFFKNPPQFHKNLSIDQIANIFKGEIEMQQYQHLVLISHSMGGLISKSLILKLIDEKEKITAKEKLLDEEKRQLDEKEKRNSELEKVLSDADKQLIEEDKKLLAASIAKLEKESGDFEIEKKKVPGVKLYISLAVPHEGANMALWAMLLLKSRQIANLAPLNKDRHDITKKWLKTPPALLPDTVYFKGNNDQVVARASSVAYEVRDNIKVVDTSDDHNSIVCPQNSGNIVITRIKEELRRLQGIEELKPDDNDLSLPGLALQSPSPKLKPKWLSFTIAFVLLLLATYGMVKYFPGYSEKKRKQKIVQQLELKLFKVFRKDSAGYSLADFLMPEYKTPVPLRGYSIKEFLTDFTMVSPVPADELISTFNIERNADNKLYALKFTVDCKKDSAGLILGVNNKFCEEVFRLGFNEDWMKDQDEKGFCRMLYGNTASDTTTLFIPKSIIK
jgi:hypothetical protein